MTTSSDKKKEIIRKKELSKNKIDMIQKLTSK